MENELARIWAIVSELSEQLVQNQKVTGDLQAQAAALKNQASNTGSGFVLRRFNTDIANETFESELERLNAQIVIENQTLLHENKQLSVLLKEYEGTLDTVMAKFRNHALATQQYELSLTRHYEALLQARETQTLSMDLASGAELAHALQRIAYLLRGMLRAMAGEDPEQGAEYDEEGTSIMGPVDPAELLALVDALDAPAPPENGGEGSGSGTGARQDWAIEREAEIVRLEAENAALRRALGIDPETLAARGVSLDFERELAGRYASVISARRRSGSGHAQQGSGGDGGPRLSYWDNGGGGGGQQQHPGMQQQQQSHFAGAPLQRAMDLQPGMRMGQATRRPGMFGAGRGIVPGALGPGPGPGNGSGPGSGGAPGAGAGMGSLWGNQPSSPAPGPWQSGGGGGGASPMDFAR